MQLRSKLAGLFLDHISTVQHRCKNRGLKESQERVYSQEWLKIGSLCLDFCKKISSVAPKSLKLAPGSFT